jgi:hypothetical protein
VWELLQQVDLAPAVQVIIMVRLETLLQHLHRKETMAEMVMEMPTMQIPEVVEDQVQLVQMPL